MKNRRLCIVGGGPTALFVFKRIVDEKWKDWDITIFERTSHLGRGMPYSEAGARQEHITNVSSDELPQLVDTLKDWVKSRPDSSLKPWDLDKEHFDERDVVPRLLFGYYLERQFQSLLEQAAEQDISVTVGYETEVLDIIDRPDSEEVEIVTSVLARHPFDAVVICSGHTWPLGHEGKVKGYFSSPYPPSKIVRRFNHPVALRGSSLTAIDAIRTLARSHGRFERLDETSLRYEVDEGVEEFKIVMHARNGFLPCVRIYLEDPQVSDEGLLSKREWMQERDKHEGFVPLDLIFEKDFKDHLKRTHPEFYSKIHLLSLEEFVEKALKRREQTDPFLFFRKEYEEALLSVIKKRPVPWKETLALLSYALNYPAKHFSAEDYLRLKGTLLPLISIVIAFVPKSSCEELIALHNSGRLELKSVGHDSWVEPLTSGGVVYHYRTKKGQEQNSFFRTYIDCVGQPSLSLEEFPFSRLREQGVISQATLAFRSEKQGQDFLQKNPDQAKKESDDKFYLKVPGIAINDFFQPLNEARQANPRIFVLAVPYIGGHNPDYSGVDFCEKASTIVIERLSQMSEKKKVSKL